MKKQKEIRSSNDIPVVGGYTLNLYCSECHGSKYEHTTTSNSLIEEIAMDGPNCYYQARKIARKRGWVLHRDGYASCPKCSN